MSGRERRRPEDTRSVSSGTRAANGAVAAPGGRRAAAAPQDAAGMRAHPPPPQPLGARWPLGNPPTQVLAPTFVPREASTVDVRKELLFPFKEEGSFICFERNDYA